MNDYQNILNKMHAISDDEITITNIDTAKQMLEELNLTYAIIGSCGLQSYFDIFFRLPNDLDVVLDYTQLPLIKEYCKEKNFQFIELLGRSKLIINTFPIHIIPMSINVIDKSTDVIFTSINLTSFFNSLVYNDVRLINSASNTLIPVLPLEVIVYIELIRPLYTGSMMSLSFIFNYKILDVRVLKLIFKQNPSTQQIVLFRLKEFKTKVLDYKYGAIRENVSSKAIDDIIELFSI